MSLDGFIAGPNGEADWIVIDPDIDFNAITSEFDTVFVGGRTFRGMIGGKKKVGKFFGMKTYVFSRTLDPRDYPELTVVADNIAEVVNRVRAEDGKDIWLFGGGLLFRSLLESGVVDSLEVAVIPVLLGQGIPLFPAPAPKAPLKLVKHTLYAKTGTLGLEYAIDRSTPSTKKAARPATSRKPRRR